MRRKDLLVMAAAVGGLLLLLAPAWFRAGRALSNFGDLYAYHYPLRHLVVGALQAGRLPFWNPYIFAGLPLSANPQSVLFYPVSLLGAIFPLTLALTWDVVFHMAWAAAGMVLLARREGLGAWAAATLAALFALCPFLVYRITEGIPTLVAALAWTPWCWLAFVARRPALLAAAWALQFLSGHPQFLVVNALGMALCALASGRRLASLATLAGGAAGALALAAAQWPLTWEFLSLSVRKGWPRAFMTGYSLDWRSLLTAVAPNAWGNPLDGTYAGPPSVFFETSGLFLGLSGLLLAAAGLVWGRRRVPLLLCAAGLFFAFGGNNPAYVWLLSWGPMGFLRTPARYLLLCLWGLLLAAACGARRLELLGDRARLVRAGLLGAVLLELVLWDTRFLATEPATALEPNLAVARSAGGRAVRLLTDPELANPNKSMLYRARNANGYEAFFLAGFPEYAARSEGRPAVDASRSYLTELDTPELRRLGVAYALRPGGKVQMNPKALRLAYFADAAGRPLPARLDIFLPSAEEWRVCGFVPEGARSLVAAEADYPGWRAWLNGRPAALERWDGLVQAVTLPPEVKPGGFASLLMRFEPRLWAMWCALAALAWLAWFAGAARAGGLA